MIQPIHAIQTILPMAGEPAGGCHGTWHKADRGAVGPTGRPAADVFRNCLIILKSDLRETNASIASQLGCIPFTVVRVRRLYREGGAPGNGAFGRWPTRGTSPGSTGSSRATAMGGGCAVPDAAEEPRTATYGTRDLTKAFNYPST